MKAGFPKGTLHGFAAKCNPLAEVLKIAEKVIQKEYAQRYTYFDTLARRRSAHTCVSDQHVLGAYQSSIASWKHLNPYALAESHLPFHNL